MAHKLGDKVLIQPFDVMNNGFIHCTIAPNENQGFFSLQKDNGKLIHFNPANGQISGETDGSIGHGEERIAFDGNNLCVSYPNDKNPPMGIFTCINLVS